MHRLWRRIERGEKGERSEKVRSEKVREMRGVEGDLTKFDQLIATSLFVRGAAFFYFI